MHNSNIARLGALLIAGTTILFAACGGNEEAQQAGQAAGQATGRAAASSDRVVPVQVAGVVRGAIARNVTVTGNVVRASGIGVAVSVVAGAGAAAITGTMFAAVKRGAIVGMDHRKPVTGDLALAGAERYPQLKIAGNQVS